MKIFITGGTGFVGQKLKWRFVQDGHDVVILSRQNLPHEKQCTYITGDCTIAGDWLEMVDESDVIVNLAGESIFKYWSTSVKTRIFHSRIDTTRVIAQHLQEVHEKKTFISASAVGYYGDTGTREVKEDNPPGSDFLAQVCTDWEGEAVEAGDTHRVVLARLGIVLGKDNGAMKILRALFKYYMGAPLGNGRQYFPWIHVDDLVEIFVTLVNSETFSGPVNCTAPHPVTNRELTETMQKEMIRPKIIPFVPSFGLKLMMGEFGKMLLGGQKALPSVLLEEDFSFKYGYLGDALKDILR